MKSDNVISVSDLYTLDFELVSMFAQRQLWVDGILFKNEQPRSKSALIYLSGCTGIYTDLISGTSFFAPQKSFVYLPYGGRYTVLNVESRLSDTDAYLVEFNIQAEEILTLSRAPVLIDALNTYYVEKSMREILDCYEAIPRSPSLLKMKVFEILMQISHNKYNDKFRKYKVIEPALEYMKKYPYATVQVENYAEMCGLSYGGFARLFKKYVGKSPADYMIENKMTFAKVLLVESELSVKEISQLLNFESTSYFCRLFKRRNSMTPSEFRVIKRRIEG